MPHTRYAPIVRGVELEHSLFVVVAQHGVRETEHARRFAAAGRTRNDQIWQVTVARNDFQPIDRLGVADNVVEQLCVCASQDSLEKHQNKLGSLLACGLYFSTHG